MEEKLMDILWEVKESKKHPNRAYKELCVLLGVSKRFKVDHNKVIKTEPKMVKESGFSFFG